MAVAAGVYTIRLADGAASGYPAVGYLACHKYHEKDTRDDSSVYAMVHSAPNDGGWGGYKWFISPVGDEGAYTIRLADATHGAAATGHLMCHKYYPKDTRDPVSVYAMVHGADKSHFDGDGYLGYKWLISPGSDEGAVTIRLADATHGAPTTGSLASHKYHEKDTRDGVSVYAMVHTAPKGGCQWVLTAV